MIVEKYGVCLKRLTKKDIEQVRIWRNHPSIQQHMDYQEHITPHMQEAWFNNINNQYNFYFLIQYQKKNIGVIHMSDIDYKKKIAKSGIFIGDLTYQNTFIPVCASLCLCDLKFHLFQLVKTNAKVSSTNLIAQKYNTNLGFVSCLNQKRTDFLQYTLTKQNYLKTTQSIRSKTQQLMGKESNIQLIINEKDMNHNDHTFIQKLYHQQIPTIQTHFAQLIIDHKK